MAQQDGFDWWSGSRTAVRTPQDEPATAAVYRNVQAGPAFREMRRGYRAFVFPATAAVLAWYLGYVGLQVTAPGLMGYQLAGPFNVAWLLALAQFGTTFLFAWWYARNARHQRDRAALELRWDTQDQLR